MTFYRSSNYNYTDWNRIENKINDIMARVNTILGYTPIYPSSTLYPSSSLYPQYSIILYDRKTDWDNYDFPFVEELDRIKNNIELLKEYSFVPYNWQEFEFDKIYFDYIEANKLESNLLGAEEVLDRAEIRYSGEGYSGETIWL